MAANPALEAVIDNDPNDIESYYIYGDWLQGQGDPRGELVALQAAVSRSPDDDKLAQRAAAHLKEHGVALLGELAEQPKRALTLGWYCGFIRSAELQLPSAKLVPVLRALVRHPSGRFLQSLRIGDARVEPDEVASLLVSEKRPRTLTEVRFSGELSEASVAELHAAFPRLNRSIDVEWRTILETVAEQRRVDLRFDASALPKLVVIDGLGVAAPEPTKILVALRLELDKQKPVGIVAAMKRTFTPESLDRFAVGLGQQFIARNGPSPMHWGFDALGRFGGPAAVEWIADGLGSWSHQRAGQGVELLREIGSEAAIFEIFAMASSRAINRPRRDEAQAVLERLAAARSLDVDRLLDRATPPVLSPRARDAVQARLLALMIDGRRLDARDFVRYVVTHPAVGPLAERLVWASYDGRDVELTFRSTGERVVDLDGQPVDLEGARVGVVHPAELDPAERGRIVAAWQDAFEALEIKPLFDQLARPVHGLRDQERGQVLTRWKLRSVGFDQLRTVLEARDWLPILDDSEWGTDGWAKFFARDNVAVTARIDTGAIGSVRLRRNGEACPFETLSAVTLSEILGELELATTRPAAKAVTNVGGVVKGSRVRVVRGADFGSKGVVFWLGDGNSGARCGFRSEDGETHWADVSAVVVMPDEAAAVDERDRDDSPARTRGAEASDDSDDDSVDDSDADSDGERGELDREADAILDKADAAAPKVGKGAHVRWVKGKHAGTGTVFWIGKNKFGDGMRAGVRDDETNETVWVDVEDCTLA